MPIARYTRQHRVCDFENIGFGDHILACTETRQQQIDFLPSFVQAALRNGDKVVYAAFNCDDVRQQLRRRGELQQPLADGSLELIEADAFYFPHGVFRAERVISQLHLACKNALNQGYNGLRVIGAVTTLPDCDSAAQRRQFLDDLIAYEYEVDIVLQALPIIGYCIYDVRQLPPPFVEQIFAAHPLLASTGKCYVNDCHSAAIIPAVDRWRQLHDQVVERAAASQQQLDCLQSLHATIQAQSEMLTNVSHDIRTPLHAIQGFVEIMQARTTDTEQLEHLQTIAAASKYMLDMTSDILLLARLEANQVPLQMQDCDIGELAESLMTLLQAKVALAKSPVELALHREHLPQGARIYTDPRRLRQILQNLLDNALEFTAHGKVCLYCPDAAAPQVQFKVTDTGVGIAGENLAKLFDPFYQISHRDAAVGTGLGLPIVAGLLRRLGGSITVSSEPGAGTTFIVTLPGVVGVSG